jgi:hypothetical protein
MKALVCGLRGHKWQQRRNPDGEAYRHCHRCGKDGEYTGHTPATRANSTMSGWPL